MNSFPLWSIPLLPLIGAVVNGLLALAAARSPRGPAKGFAAFVGVAMPALSFLMVLLAASSMGTAVSLPQQNLWTWITVGDELDVGFSLLFDRLTSMMLLFVTGIGTLIHLYSVGYMWADRGFARFMCYMNLFMFSMIMLVIGGSLPVTFLGWEGVGLCSYLLIGFWTRNKEYGDAARKAFVMNRIGDLGFLLGAFALLQVCGTLDYRGLAAWFADEANVATLATSAGGWVTAAGLLIFLGCTGKSAQIPLLTWLPDAMAGPTPVSALIHAATMVTSGVYLLARLDGVYDHCDPSVMATILVVGCLTAVFGAVAGLFQNDIKKALAYSTVSQLGFMFMAAGLGQHEVALFHVFTHAFFKATLFLGAGAIIHSLHHEQDMRRMGGLHALTVHGHKPFYIAYMALCFGWYAILGLPLGSGFMSKDLILERLFEGHAHAMGVNLAPIVGVVGLLTAGITAIYMTRVMVLTFWSPSRVSPEAKAHITGTPITMAIPLVILGAGSMGVGMLWFEPLRNVLRGAPFSDYLAPIFHPEAAAATTALGAHAEVHHGPAVWMVPLAALVVAAIGIAIAVAVWRRGPRGASVEAQPSSDPVGFGASWTWAFDRIYHVLVVLPTRWIGLILYWLVEQALIGGLTYLVAEFTAFLGDGYASVQRSRLRVSLALAVAGVAAILWITPLSAGLNHLWAGLGSVLRAFY